MTKVNKRLLKIMKDEELLTHLIEGIRDRYDPAVVKCGVSLKQEDINELIHEILWRMEFGKKHPAISADEFIELYHS